MHLCLRLRLVLAVAEKVPGLSPMRVEVVFDLFQLLDAFPVQHILLERLECQRVRLRPAGDWKDVLVHLPETTRFDLCQLTTLWAHRIQG